MKTFHAYAVLFTSLVGAGALFASAQVIGQPTGKDNPAEEQVRRLNAEEVEAFLHNDPKTMARLWSDDFVVTNPPAPGGGEPTDPLTGFRTQESGTYQVFPDCTGQATINFPPHPGGLVIQFSFVLSSHGSKLHAVVSALTPPGAPGPIPGVAVRSDAEKIGRIKHDRD